MLNSQVNKRKNNKLNKKSWFIKVCVVIQIFGFSSWGMASDSISVIPQPQSIVYSKSQSKFAIDSRTIISYTDSIAKPAAELLAGYLRPVTGYPLKVIESNSTEANRISFRLSKVARLDGYRLEAKSGGVAIMASKAGGFLSGVQTLRQLLPPEVYASDKKDVEWTVGFSGTITDYAVYSWRGMMLDTSRYFFTKEYILRYLDMMAMHKLNVFHWHLIDDSGWRIEIKKYPKLTEIGSKRGSGPYRLEGYYSQDDIREIVAYAAKRNIEVVPEIEIPAHTLAALAAYPELGCFNKKFTVPDRHSISPEIYCAGKESTYRFLENVMDEVTELFPSQYIHIGGDEAKYDRWKECPACQELIKREGLKNEKELQGYMTDRIRGYLALKGKKVIGWAEVLHCGVSKDIGIMAWHKPSDAQSGARQGHLVVCSFCYSTYFDTPESRLPGEPPAATWIPPVTLQKAYQWDPTPDKLRGTVAAKNILGPNGAVWSDQFMHKREILHDKPGAGTTRSENYIDYLSLPRMAALAEVAWTERSKRNYADFLERMKTEYLRYQMAGYHFRMPTPLLNVLKSGDKISISAEAPIAGGKVRYTIDGSAPTEKSPLLNSRITLPANAEFRARTFAANGDKSLVFMRVEKKGNRHKRKKYGKVIGKWGPNTIGAKKPKTVMFDVTGIVNRNGKYIVTFVYTGGESRVDIDAVSLVHNDSDIVAKDVHHGFSGGQVAKNSYTLKVNNYETGASYKVKALLYGDVGNDSRGTVFIKRR